MIEFTRSSIHDLPARGKAGNAPAPRPSGVSVSGIPDRIPVLLPDGRVHYGVVTCKARRFPTVTVQACGVHASFEVAAQTLRTSRQIRY